MMIMVSPWFVLSYGAICFTAGAYVVWSRGRKSKGKQ